MNDFDGSAGAAAQPSPPRQNWRRRTAWVIGLLAAALFAAVILAAYRQPELLLNLMGLRYCG